MFSNGGTLNEVLNSLKNGLDLSTTGSFLHEDNVITNKAVIMNNLVGFFTGSGISYSSVLE